MEKRKSCRIKLVNKIYLVLLIFILIIIMIISFKTGKQMYYLINTNLDNQNTDVDSDIANWKFQVTIEY